MSASRVRAHLRKARRKNNLASLTTEEKTQEATAIQNFVIFGGRRGNGSGGSFEDLKPRDPQMSKREEQVLRAKMRLQKALEDAEKHPVRGKPIYIKQPGQLKKARSKEVQDALKLAAFNKREWRAEKRRAWA